jgi:hypothetical protein
MICCELKEQKTSMDHLEPWPTDSVPTVNPNDIKNLVEMRGELLKQYGDTPTILGRDIFARACSPNSDAMAAWYRTSILALLLRGALLPSDLSDEAKSVVFELVAKFPMKQIEIGKVFHGLPTEFQELATKIKQQLDILGQQA